MDRIECSKLRKARKHLANYLGIEFSTPPCTLSCPEGDNVCKYYEDERHKLASMVLTPISPEKKMRVRAKYRSTGLYSFMDTEEYNQLSERKEGSAVESISNTTKSLEEMLGIDNIATGIDTSIDTKDDSAKEEETTEE